jgi:hypothetical protein
VQRHHLPGVRPVLVAHAFPCLADTVLDECRRMPYDDLVRCVVQLEHHDIGARV